MQPLVRSTAVHDEAALGRAALRATKTSVIEHSHTAAEPLAKHVHESEAVKAAAGVAVELEHVDGAKVVLTTKICHCAARCGAELHVIAKVERLGGRSSGRWGWPMPQEASCAICCPYLMLFDPGKHGVHEGRVLRRLRRWEILQLALCHKC